VSLREREGKEGGGGRGRKGTMQKEGEIDVPLTGEEGTVLVFYSLSFEVELDMRMQGCGRRKRDD